MMLCIAQAGVMHSDADMENLNNEQQRQQRPRNYYWTVIEQRIRPKCNEYSPRSLPMPDTMVGIGFHKV